MAEIVTMGEMLVEIMRPEAGTALSECGLFRGPFPSGAPAIFIDTVARLGHSAAIIGGVGRDEFGDCLLRRLVGDGVNCDNVMVVPGKSTAVAFVTYFADGSRKFIFHIDGTPAVMARFPTPTPLSTPTYFHVMGCLLMANDGFREMIFAAAETFFAAGAQITFDPNIRPELLGNRTLDEVVGPILHRSSVIFPGIGELRMLSGADDIESGIARMFENPTLQVILLKRGKWGCNVYTRETCLEKPTYPLPGVDPTGAGDAFDAGFLCGLLEGRSIDGAADMANAAGALNASAFGPMEGAISVANMAEVMRGT